MRRYLKLKVTADAREDVLTMKSADSFAIRVRAPAQEGRANRAALQILAAHLKIAPQALRIVKGAHQPAKIIEVRVDTTGDR